MAKAVRARKMPDFSPHVNAFLVTDLALAAD
jgi:hypothetical protein